jgi:hypothetical protein
VISSSRQRKAQKVDAVTAKRDEDGMGLDNAMLRI